MLTIRLLDAIDICYKWKLVLKKKRKKKKIKFHIFRFCPTFDVIFECIPSSKMQKKTTFVLQFVLG